MTINNKLLKVATLGMLKTEICLEFGNLASLMPTRFKKPTSPGKRPEMALTVVKANSGKAAAVTYGYYAAMM